MADATIHFTGNLGGAPEARTTQDGTPVVSASVAVNKSKKVGSTGDARQDYETVHTTWYRVSWWREIAQAVAAMNLEKGQTITVDGEVFEEEYTTRDGAQGKSLNVTATGVRAYPKRQQQGGAPQSPPQSGYGQPQGAPQSDPWVGGGNQGGYDDPPF
ncbi:single-stranded DNA-binding protein [Brachybacterium sp. SGAir0954]|uniref:single-stranded DNA-binding protein n=1 Tax=Brachybacterium sp. SGAir0954 TaxID=2571029 RepID=UPI0010CD3DF4|nr:single-stranded DNA-binding protein [Brachybacterium sp. SGAir0954]QCR53236.1 single-stranded DNA-binding protein [Brachybacterium sp. SGAir0954]